MGGFAEAAIGLAFAAQLAAVGTLIVSQPAIAVDEPVPAAVQKQRPATQKLMRNPWERAAVADERRASTGPSYLRTK
jgi:hypothetical protein